MINIPKITAADMQCFVGKKTIIYGYSRNAKDLVKIFQHLNIDVVGICTEKQRVSLGYKGVPIISLSKAKEMIQQNNNFIVVFSIADKEERRFIQDELEMYTLEFSDVSINQLIVSFMPALYIDSLKDSFVYILESLWWRRFCKRKKSAKLLAFKLRNPRNPLVLCLPMKTADYTLNYTFDRINATADSLQSDSKDLFFVSLDRFILDNQRNVFFTFFQLVLQPFNKQKKEIEYVNVGHKPRVLNLESYARNSTVRLISALREPISQNVSSFYEAIDNTYTYKDWILGALENLPRCQRDVKLRDLENLFVQNGNDGQLLFDDFVSRYVYGTQYSLHAKSMQNFMMEFSQHVVDITKYPFDKEKGFTIIRNGNVEVFIYQLEKLNSLVSQLSEWVGVPFDELENGNQASDKWIAESYKQAQKEIKFSQEYFDRCFDEAYVKHCYSEADIENFKAKWRSHVIS